MSSRERFEEFMETGACDHGEPTAWLSPLAEDAAWQAWQARDAEVERLVEALRRTVTIAEFWINREDRREMSESQWQTWHALGHGSNAIRDARALLREYDKEKRDE